MSVFEVRSTLNRRTLDRRAKRDIISLLFDYADMNGKLSAELEQARRERDAMAAALSDAATSLQTIARDAGKDEFLTDVLDIRGYAGSRALAARTALAAAPPLPEQGGSSNG